MGAGLTLLKYLGTSLERYLSTYYRYLGTPRFVAHVPTLCSQIRDIVISHLLIVLQLYSYMCSCSTGSFEI